MKISQIETYPVRIPFKPKLRPMAPPGHEQGAEFVIVRIVTDCGREGVGEASGTPRWSGETVWGTRALIDRVLAPRLLGADPLDIADINQRMDRVCKHNSFSKAAIEMACWDIAGKAADKPVFALLGAGSSKVSALRSRLSVGGVDPAEAAILARNARDCGFDTIKVKVGGAAEQDLERVRQVREAAGSAMTLVIDAVGGWTADEAVQMLQDLAACDISWMEQPTVAGDFHAMREVRRRYDCPIIADDGCFTLVEVEELVRNACCDAFSLYPGKNGGIQKAMDIAAYATQRGLLCTIGSNGEWDIATAAGAHLALGCADLSLDRLPGDHRGPAAYEFSLLKNPIRIDGPFTYVSEGSGLGVEVDWALVHDNRAPA